VPAVSRVAISARSCAAVVVEFWLISSRMNSSTLPAPDAAVWPAIITLPVLIVWFSPNTSKTLPAAIFLLLLLC
jgi:hypothetical protein